MGSSFETYSERNSEREFSRSTAEATLQQVISDLKDAYNICSETAPTDRKDDQKMESAFSCQSIFVACQ